MQVLAEVDSKYYSESGVDVCDYELRVSKRHNVSGAVVPSGSHAI